MKKILIILLSLLILCACGSNKDTTAEQGTEAITNNAISSVTISNNDAYDEGESSEPDLSELLASENGIEIYGKNNQTLVTPADGMWEVIFLVKNNNDFSVEIDHGSNTDVTGDNFTGAIADSFSDFSCIAHPNSSDYIIEPNSELQIIFDISLPNFNNQAESVEGDLIFHYEFLIFESSGDAYNDTVADINIALNSYVKYLGRDYRNDENNRDATIKGKVVDINSNPICDVEIEVNNAIDEGNAMVRTDNNGEFEIKVSAYKSTVTNMWHECVLKFNHPSYDNKYICVYPKNGETNEVLINLLQPSQSLTYTNTAIVDLGIQAYSYDTNADKSVIAFTPFHSGLNYENIEDKVNINVTDYDGNVKYQYHLNAEAPWVCMSDDGKYVVTEQAIDAGNEQSTYIVVLDENGDAIYTKDIGKETDTPQGTVLQTIHSRCAQLSHDNKYLVIGSDEGDFWVVDWQNDTILWTYKTHGQVRNIVFNEENNIILVSSGDAFMYGFDIDGNLLFKTYVGSWATDMELVDNKLAYTLKTGFDSVGVIDITSGEKIWTYAARARGSGLAVSKDKKYLWWGNDVSSVYSSINNVLFDLETGEIAYVLDVNAGQEAMFSDDGNYLVVKTSTELEVFETQNYSCVMYIPVIDKNGGENTASINQTVVVNSDASKIVAAFNNDPSERIYGQAYYYELTDKKIYEYSEDTNNNNENAEQNDDAVNAGAYRIEGNNITFERDTEYRGIDTYDVVTINTGITVSLSTSDNENVDGLIINKSLVVENAASLVCVGNGPTSPRLEFADGSSATGIELYSEGGDLLNKNSEFINDSGSTITFIWNDGKLTIEP